jgi:hypothetical protein
MARHGDYLFRRNGRFYARLRIPRLLQAVYGKPDLRVSLDTVDYPTARLRVLEVVLGWKRTFARMTAMLDPRQLVAGSPLLAGDGLIPIESAAREMGLSVANVLTEARNRALELRIEASAWEGTEMPAGELEFEDDGSLVLNCALGRPTRVVIGPLFLRTASLSLVKDGIFEDCLFFRDRQRIEAVVLQAPGASVAVGALLIDKKDADGLRQTLAGGVTPDMIQAADAARAAMLTAPSAPKHKYSAMKSSALLHKFFHEKTPHWSKATIMDMTTMCGAFVDLMSDPILGDIDGPMMIEYRGRLAQLPSHVGIARRKTGVKSFTDLIAVATAMDKMKPERVSEYMGKLSEFLGWAADNGYMERNPAAGAMKRKKKTRREQDERQPISAENLKRIFSAPWFQTGHGERTAKGLHWSFQPHHFWLPLLGLFVGGRLNELSQLYLDDVKQSATGQWYLDFNTDQPDKLDLDDADDIVIGEKRFKTVNAVRVVPLHSMLVQLGLLEYVAALRATGQHQRLFPELLWNETKGYSKQASRWFNELFMGRQLHIKRDGSQVFHSLRHNFITALDHVDVPERVIAQLAGHERGETMSGKRYAKDREAAKLATHIERLTYELPPIARFGVADGLVALEHALARKRRATTAARD